jgi:hypothetical protein
VENLIEFNMVMVELCNILLGGPFDFSEAIKSAEMLYNMRPENNMSDQEVILPR